MQEDIFNLQPEKLPEYSVLYKIIYEKMVRQAVQNKKPDNYRFQLEKAFSHNRHRKDYKLSKLAKADPSG